MARWSSSVNIPCHIQLELIRQFSNGDASLRPPVPPAEGAASEFDSNRGHEAHIEKLNFNVLLHNLILIVADAECILINRTVWKVDSAAGQSESEPSKSASAD